jgi:hypothetical protein
VQSQTLPLRCSSQSRFPSWRAHDAVLCTAAMKAGTLMRHWEPIWNAPGSFPAFARRYAVEIPMSSCSQTQLAQMLHVVRQGGRHSDLPWLEAGAQRAYIGYVLPLEG